MCNLYRMTATVDERRRVLGAFRGDTSNLRARSALFRRSNGYRGLMAASDPLQTLAHRLPRSPQAGTTSFGTTARTATYDTSIGNGAGANGFADLPLRGCARHYSVNCSTHSTALTASTWPPGNFAVAKTLSAFKATIRRTRRTKVSMSVTRRPVSRSIAAEP